MSNNRYLEFDSTYRNRNEWPLASEFQIPISQSGRKNNTDALDPVCLSTPITAWTSNLLNATTSSVNLTGDILFNNATPVLESNTSDNQSFIIRTAVSSLQQLENYYSGLVITTTSGLVISRRRILSYKYLNSDGTYDYGIVTTETSFPEGILDGTNFIIKDPTDLSDTSNPYFFVPAGRIQKNGYTGYILYNETYKQYRPISEYISITHMISLDTTGTASFSSGPVTGWLATHNYSIRKEIPYSVSSTYQFNPIAPFSSNSIVVAGLGYTDTNFYKNFAIRIIPDGSLGTPQYYDYINSLPYNSVTGNLTNQDRIVSSSTYNSGSGNTTFILNQPLTFTPSGTTLFEILPFSYDNFNPFTYTGSMVSQQDMVCYEVELLNLILPNEVLAVGEGGRIAFYPYVYVQISNVSSSNGRLSNIIYSNNPHAVRAIFRVPIDDVINPIISTFIKVDGDGMVQTIKFKPNDNLYFSVFLSNGELYKTILPERYSPASPNPASQISASFSIRRL